MDRAWDAANDASKDDEADAVANAALRDELTHPHEEERTGGEDDDLHQGLWAGKVECRGQHLLAIQKRKESVALEERQWDRQVAGVLIDLVSAVLALSAQLNESWHHAAHELHDDRGVDVRVQTEAYHAESRQATA